MPNAVSDPSKLPLQMRQRLSEPTTNTRSSEGKRPPGQGTQNSRGSMVRTAIACAWCRRSKIKCVHEGEPPCRNCLRNGRTSPGDCVLTSPKLGSASRKRQRTSGRLPARLITGDTGTEELSDGESSSFTPGAVRASDSRTSVLDAIRTTPRAAILQAATSFTRKFPELSFLHLGSIHVDSEEHSSIMLRAALMTLHSRRREDYATYVKSALSGVLFESPKLATVQTLLILAMYEWGNGRGYDAWMATGTAIRMIQTMESMRSPTAMSELEQEIYNRTFWSCFIMDRLVLCGKTQPFTLPLSQMSIHLPIRDQDFAFGQSYTPRVHVVDVVDSDHNNIDYAYSILVRGFDIWARILKWVVNGGRRQAGMTAVNNCPWTPGSPWRVLRDDIETWRRSQHKRLKFPGVRIADHISLGHGEQFAYINLIYYISILFLSREYIPFLPTPESEPQGPADPPFLEATAPLGWWADRAEQLFDAAMQITTLLQQLDDLDASLLTPFAGFCSFSAASMNAYVTSFPRMNHGKSDGAPLLEVNIQWLSRFKDVWKMGNGWFKTILDVRDLYTRASTDRQRFQGKTRADFQALEASIHDSSGISPIQDADEVITEGGRRPQLDRGLASEESPSVPQLPYPSHDAERADQALEDLYHPTEFPVYNQWNQVWPLWGEQQSGPFITGGFQFDNHLQHPGD